jgi:predicted DsbA family dithiol-disulfide isomerase
MSTSQKTNGNKQQQQLKIDITSDNICPWCFIGKRRLEKALSQIDTSNINVSISWYPFQLDPGLPRDGSLIKLDRYKQKFGETRVKQMLPQMIETGKQEGIEFSFGGKVGSTFDSHRLLYYVKQQENGEKKQNDLINILFHYYFEQEQDLSDHQVLIKAAEQVGFNPVEIKQFLQSDQYKKEVQQEINQSQEEGISGVPHFRINDRIELSGAQDPQQFIQAFRKAGVNV